MLDFYNARIISVRIDKMSNKLYAGLFKIYAEGLWISATAFFNNIYITVIKRLCHLFFVGDKFVFVKKCYIDISYATFICKKWLYELSP